MKMVRLLCAFSLLVLVSVAPAFASDDSMTVVVDKRTGQYHLPSCPKVGSNVATSTLIEASERQRACPICSPVKAALAAAEANAAIGARKQSALAAQVVAKAAADAAAAVASAPPAPESVAAAPPTTTSPIGSALSSGATTSGSGGSVHVKGYTRKDGTYVRPHTRKSPRS
jgi:hypothetical protein